jgi:predicted O-methyltransferase YrrM
MKAVFSMLRRVVQKTSPVMVPECVRAAKGSWCEAHIAQYTPGTSPLFTTIEQLAEKADALGPQPLWKGYVGLKNYPAAIGENAMRRASQVCTNSQKGLFFAWLAEHKKPATILEFGSAFGASGMYWLAGIEAHQHGRLLTFEPNGIWAEIAAKNLAAISERFVLTNAIFEDHVARLKSEGVVVDIAFIDAIHTSEFVNRQLELVLSLAAPGAIILIDDVNFSDDMRDCWRSIAADARFVAAYLLGGQIGMVELRR